MAEGDPRKMEAVQRAREIVRASEWFGDPRVNMTTLIGAGRVLDKALGEVECLFRDLRDAWFREMVMVDNPEREWDGENQRRYREELNERLRAQFDRDTEALLAGDQRRILNPELDELL